MNDLGEEQLIFEDRADAGARLAERLSSYESAHPLIFGVARYTPLRRLVGFDRWPTWMWANWEIAALVT